MPEEPPMPDFDDSMIPPPPEEYLPPVPADEFFEEAPIPEEKPLPTATTKPIQEKRPEPIQRSAPTDVNPSDEEGGPWQELMALKDIADTVREKDRGLCALLANYCRAVYNKKQVVFLCDNDRDLAELKTPQNMAIISEALEKNRRVGYEVKVAKGNINEYVKQNSTYDNIESNGYFDFN